MPDVDYIYPTKTKTIRDDFADHVKRGSVLPGIDLAANTGDKVWATANGVVALADANPKQVRGMNVIIRHRDGKESHYLHLSRVDVKNGQRVKARDIIGLAGNTGTTSTGAHLHFAIKKHGVCVDPAKLLKKEAKERRIAKAAELASVPVDVPIEETPETVAG